MKKKSTPTTQKAPALAPSAPYKRLNLGLRFRIAHLGNTGAARAELAVQLGVSISTLTRYLNNDDMPLQLFLHMAAVLNMEPVELANPNVPIRAVQLTIFSNVQLAHG